MFSASAQASRRRKYCITPGPGQCTFSLSMHVLYYFRRRICLYDAKVLFKETSEVSVMRLEGQRINRYNLLQLIGSGGMGEVYLAEDPRVGQQVAIKVVRDEVTLYPE